jgi:hypothetical protein
MSMSEVWVDKSFKFIWVSAKKHNWWIFVRVRLVLFKKIKSNCRSTWPYHFASVMQYEFLMLYNLANIWFCPWFFIFSYSNRCTVVFMCYFNCDFSGMWYWASFLCLFADYISFLVRNLIRSLAYVSIRLFVFLSLNFKNLLCILEINHALDKCFVKIFSQSVVFFPIPLTNYIFAEKKALILMKSIL